MKWQNFLAPQNFYQNTARVPICVGVLSLILLVIASIWGLYFAPPDRYQQETVRILYVHVPAALLAQSAFMLMGLAALIFLVWKIKLADLCAQAIAPFGAAMTFLALFSGSIWGIPTWGTAWVWDARLTSMLILFFIYAAIIALRQAYQYSNTGSKAVSILILVGVINIPIIKYSVLWWNTLHQPSSFSFTKGASMPMSMWMPLLIMLIGFYLGFLAFVITRMRTLVLKREWRARWVELELFKVIN